MARLANFEIELAARDKRLARDLNRARYQWRKYSRAVIADARRVQRAVTRAAAGGAAALAAMSAKALESGDRIAKAARNANLSAAAFQRLSHVWELSGSSAETLTKASQGLSRNVLQLERGLSTAVDTFGMLGLRLKDLQGRSAEEQLTLVIDRLRGVEEQTRRTGIAQQLFGRAGKEIGTILETTNEQLRWHSDRLERLGGVIGDRALKSIEAFNDEVSLLKRVVLAQYTQGMTEAISSTQQWDRVIAGAGAVARRLGSILPRVGAFLFEVRTELAYGVAAWVAYKLAVAGAAFIAAIRNAGKALMYLVRIFRTLTLAQLAAAAAPIAITAAVTAVAAGVALVAKAVKDNWEAISAFALHYAQEVRVAWERNVTAIHLAFTWLGNKVIQAFKRIARAVEGLPGTDAIVAKIDAIAEGSQRKVDRLNNELRMLQKLLKDLEGSRPALPAGAIADSITGNVREIVATIKRRIREIRSALGLDGGPSFPDLPPLPQGGRVTPTVPLPPGMKDPATGELGRAAAPTALQQESRRFARRLANVLGDALRGGDWSKVGTNLVLAVHNQLVDNVVDRLATLFSSTLQRVFSRSMGGGGGGGLGGLLGIVGNAFGFAGGGSTLGQGIRWEGPRWTGHRGGMVPGAPGQEVMVRARAREWVLTPEQRQGLLSGLSRPVVNLSATIVGDRTNEVVRVIRREARMIGDIARERIRLEGVS